LRTAENECQSGKEDALHERTPNGQLSRSLAKLRLRLRRHFKKWFTSGKVRWVKSNNRAKIDPSKVERMAKELNRTAACLQAECIETDRGRHSRAPSCDDMRRFGHTRRELM
jgi:hypothetical protein